MEAAQVWRVKSACNGGVTIWGLPLWGGWGRLPVQSKAPGGGRERGARWRSASASDWLLLMYYMGGRLYGGGAPLTDEAPGSDWLLPMYYTPREGGVETHYCAMWYTIWGLTLWGGDPLTDEAPGSDWLLPMYYTPREGGVETHYCAMWRSGDRGITWGDEAAMSARGQFLAQPTV
eukprot:1031862-Prorocentrum_minimum.AAC.1